MSVNDGKSLELEILKAPFLVIVTQESRLGPRVEAEELLDVGADYPPHGFPFYFYELHLALLYVLFE